MIKQKMGKAIAAEKNRSESVEEKMIDQSSHLS
jgi:hypothetical protein